MKRYILFILCFTVFYQIINGQSDLKTEKIKDDRLVKILNGLTLFSEKKTNDLSIKIFSVDNEPGSAGHDSGEITHDLYIAVSQFDEYPLQNVFNIGQFYNPKLINWTGEEIYQIISIEHGEISDRQTIKIKITIDKIIIIK